ncbi:MAG TPA: hypothetical protein VKV40_06935 [Ktedonobacteraceae bacterium]|nr:hypothetical protein [Ktedonobacteraceae bacterium]
MVVGLRSAPPPLVREKLVAFEQIQPEFEACFRFVQDVQGQNRFQSFPVRNTVYFLHALWLCECKDRLLSVYHNIERYEGRYCLELMRGWQNGSSADVVAFIQRKLDMPPLAQLVQQYELARQNGGDFGLVNRLAHGRVVLIIRGMNLLHALDAIFALAPDELQRQVQAACAEFGHQPEQIEQQLAEMEKPIYDFVPHQTLAQRNMTVMNALGMQVMNYPSDQPGQRSWRVLAPTVPPGPYAQHVIVGYLERIAPWYNNPRNKNFVDRPEYNDTEKV